MSPVPRALSRARLWTSGLLTASTLLVGDEHHLVRHVRHVRLVGRRRLEQQLGHVELGHLELGHLVVQQLERLEQREPVVRLPGRPAPQRLGRAGPERVGRFVMSAPMTSPTTSATPPVASASFRAIGTTNTILATEPDALDAALAITRSHLRAVDRAVSRFRDDSEVSRLALRARRGPAEAFVSPTFADYLEAALRVARLTGGLVDPTIGSALVAEGYDGDLDVVRGRGGFHQVRV